MIDPIHAHYQHKGKDIPILIVGEVGDCWEAHIAGGLRRIPKELQKAFQEQDEEA